MAHRCRPPHQSLGQACLLTCHAGKTETWGSKDNDTHSAMLRCVSCATEWAVDESVLLEAAADDDGPPAGAVDDAAGYVSAWVGDRQRT